MFNDPVSNFPEQDHPEKRKTKIKKQNIIDLDLMCYSN
jgi:hypothetical protein